MSFFYFNVWDKGGCILLLSLSQDALCILITTSLSRLSNSYVARYLGRHILSLGTVVNILYIYICV
ncbi:hypothetical protein F5X96DRAFT_104283 [Biscogniauxia mediterranea]|nr:hypothetical protein F5X96DRAFT_104283 [Biscogniauxia mediterranea]